MRGTYYMDNPGASIKINYTPFLRELLVWPQPRPSAPNASRSSATSSSNSSPTLIWITHEMQPFLLVHIIITFYSVSRLGEFTVPAISKFQPSRHITRAHCTKVLDHNNTIILSFHLPMTKCSKSGETTQCARLDHLTDPVGWLDNHLRINNPGPNDHLFAWRHPKYGLRPLTKTEVTKRIYQVVIQHMLPEIKGHSFRIGGTLHYLLLGTLFNVVKTMGR